MRSIESFAGARGVNKSVGYSELSLLDSLNDARNFYGAGVLTNPCRSSIFPHGGEILGVPTARRGGPRVIGKNRGRARKFDQVLMN